MIRLRMKELSKNKKPLDMNIRVDREMALFRIQYFDSNEKLCNMRMRNSVPKCEPKRMMAKPAHEALKYDPKFKKMKQKLSDKNTRKGSTIIHVPLSVGINIPFLIHVVLVQFL